MIQLGEGMLGILLLGYGGWTFARRHDLDTRPGFVDPSLRIPAGISGAVLMGGGVILIMLALVTHFTGIQ
jgi:hypothetical protein